MRVFAGICVCGVLSLGPAAVAVATAEPPAPAAAVGHLSVVQAVPEAAVDVTLDGRSVSGKVDTGKVVGPYELSPGDHELKFTDAAGLSLATTVSIAAEESVDIVLHLPAEVGGDPVVNSYQTPMEAIGDGKARVLVAHTATVAPADVVVDGSTVFTNIANGEFATADVPAGDHVVELLPTGETGQPLLGPLDVTLQAGTVTNVYAIGNPDDDSMQLIAHGATLPSADSPAPDTIATGSAGLAAGIVVRAFGPSL